MAKKQPSKKRAKIEELDEANGKVEDPLASIRALEKLLDMGGNNPYKTLNKQIFLERLERMNLDEARQLATRVGVVPVNRREELNNRLIDNFDDYIRRHQLLVGGFASKKIDPKSAVFDGIRDLIES